MGKHSLILFIICSLFSFFSLAQSEKTDSIKAAITQLPEDSTKVNALLDLSSAVFRSKPDTAIIYAEQARDLAAKIQFQKGLGYALKNIGLAYYIKSDFVAVLDYWHQSLDIFIAMDDKLGISNLNNNIGAVHFNYGDDPKALEYYLESLQAAEQLGDKVRMATALTNIGAIYFKNPVTHDKAFDYYKRAMDISEETGNLDAIGTSAVNLGEYYLEEKQYQSALNMFEKALPAMEETGGNTSYVLMNMGKVFALQDSLDQAVRFHQAAIQSGEEKNAKFQTLQALIGLASTYKQKGDYQESLNNYLKAETIAQEEGWNVELKDAYGGLSKAYADLSDYSNAYKYQVLFNNIRDTLNNIESERRMANIQFRFDLEKKEAEIALLKKDRELNQATIKQANILRNFLFAITGLLVIIMGGIYYQYRFAQKTNKVIRKERNRAEEILLNILPYDTAQELKEKGYVQAKRFEQTTVLFTDFKEFTKIAESNSPENLVKSIDYYFTHFDEIISRHKLEKIKTIGDAYMCAGGLPVPNQSNPIDAVKAAIEIANFVQSVKINPPEGILPFDVRIGINTGPVVAGVVGTKKFQYDIWGSTVNVAARMESSSDSGKINVSENIYRLIKDEFECEYRGEIAAKNGEEFKMYYVNASVN